MDNVSVIISIIVWIQWQGTSMAGELLEYCQSESFTAQCPEHHVIQIDRALYGRIQIGRCVTENFGFQCINDVQYSLDAFCSGERSCDVNIDQTSFPAARPCHNDLKSYLLANYTCIPVASARPDSCRYLTHVSAPVSSEGRGVLASSVTRESNCGTADVPWVVEGLPGQRINITMIDFSLVSRSTTPGSRPTSSSSCRVYATLRENHPQRRSHTICGGQQRATLQYMSTGHSVQVRILTMQSSPQNTPVNFLLRYEIVGCATPLSLPGGWVERQGNTVQFGCNDDSENWRQVCEGNQWVGPSNNCTLDPAVMNNLMQRIKALPHGLSIVIIVGIALVIGLSILLVGLLCLRWRRKSLLAAYTENTAQQSYPQQGPGYGKNITTLDHMAPLDMYAQRNEYATMKYNQIHNQNQQQQRHMDDSMGPYSSRAYKDHIYESPDIGRRHQQLETGSDDTNSDMPHYYDLDQHRMSSTPGPAGVAPGPAPPNVWHPDGVSSAMPQPYNVFDSNYQGHGSG